MLYVLVVFLLLVVAARSGKHHKKEKATRCQLRAMGPFLYITTHDEVANILKYSLDGCLIHDAVLQDLPPVIAAATDGGNTSADLDEDDYWAYYYGSGDKVGGGGQKPRPVPDSASQRLIEYRTMALGRWYRSSSDRVDDALFVTDAVSGESAVHVYSQCDAVTGQRRYLHTIIDTYQNIGADHGYGLCLDQRQRVYMSFQHTGVVLRYRFQSDSHEYEAMDLPPVLQRPGNVNPPPAAADDDGPDEVYNRPRHYYNYFPGTFYQFGKPGLQNRAQQGVRSILLMHTLSDGTLVANNQKITNQDFLRDHPHGVGANEALRRPGGNNSSTEVRIVKSELWIANEDIDGIMVVDVDTGVAFNVIIVHNPISMFFDAVSSRVYVSSKRKHWQGAVYAVNPYTYRVTATYTTQRMNHPTGITVYNNILYVAELVLAQVLKFEVVSKKYLGVAIPNVPGEIEHILLSPC